MSEKEKGELAEQIERAIQQGSIVAGKFGSGGDRGLGQMLEAQVNWREMLRDFVTATCSGRDFSTWKKPNRRFMSARVYMPSGVTERVEELLIAIDTSGSIRQSDLTMFLSEVACICNTVTPELIRLLYWDTSIAAEELYGDAALPNTKPLTELVDSTKPAGGGGTTVSCVSEYVRANNLKPQAIIVLTDGHVGSDWGTWPNNNLMWGILDNKSARAPIGKTVHIDSKS